MVPELTVSNFGKNMIEPSSARRPNYLKRSRFFAAAAAYAAFAASICALCAQTVFDVTVQPFEDTQFFADGVQAAPQVLETDNTLALLRFTFADEPQRLEIRHEGFRPVVLTHEELCRKQGFAFLSREDSDYDVVSVFQTGAKPKSVRFINATQAAVTLLEANGADIIDTQSGTVRRIRPPADYARKEGFVESLVLPERNELWLSQMSASCVHVFDLNTLDYKRSVKLTGEWCKVMAYNSASGRVYVSNWISRDISVINPAAYEEERKIPVAAVPRGMAFSRDGSYLYCAQFEDSSGRPRCKLIKKELSTFKTVSESGTPGAKRHIVTDFRADRLYVSDMLNSCIEVYSLKDDSLIASIKVFNNPNTVVLSPDRSLLYVSCRGPNNPEKGYLYKGFKMGRLDIIDTRTLEVTESIEAGNQPTGLDVSPDGRTVILSDFLDNRVRVFRRRER